MRSANRGTAIVPLSTIGARYGNSVSTPYASKSNGTTRPQLTSQCRESKRKTNTEIQYRPRIVDTDIDCGPRFCSDPVSETPKKSIMCKWTRPFWGTDCRRAPKASSRPRQPLFAAPAWRELESACGVSIL